MKIKFILLILLVFLIFSVLAEEVKETELESINFDSLGILGNISASGVEVGIQNYENDEGPQKDAIISVKDEKAVVQIGDMEFKNMQPNKSSLKVDKNGKLRSANFTASEKTVYDFGEVPANSQVTFDEKKGWIINAPKDSEISEDVGFKDVKIIGENIKFPDGKTFSGELNYDSNGQAHIESGKTAVINNVEISTFDDLPVYFDGLEHEGNYLSFGEDKVLGAVNKDSSFDPEEIDFGGKVEKTTEGYVATDYRIKFEKGNPYAHIDENDILELNVLNGQFELINNDKIGKIPTLNSNGAVWIAEDSKNLFLDENKIYMEKSNDYSNNLIFTTTPLQISFFDQKGNNAISSDLFKAQNNVMFVDNANRFAIAPDGEEKFYTELEGIKTGFSSRLSYNYVTEEDLEILTGNKISFEGEVTQNQKDLTYQRFRDYWNNLDEVYKGDINEVVIGNSDYFIQEDHSLAKGYAERTGKLYLRAGDIGEEFNYGLVRHESAHIHHFNLQGEEFSQLSNLYDEYAGYKKNSEYLESQLGSFEEGTVNYQTIQDQLLITDELKEEKYNFYLSERERLESSSEFDVKWKEILGDVPEVTYSKFKGYIYSDTLESSPREGLVRAYGGTVHHEDIATYVEKIKYPKFFSNLINPSSDEYDIRYREKIDLLYQYAFISDEEYHNILEAAGVK